MYVQVAGRTYHIVGNLMSGLIFELKSLTENIFYPDTVHVCNRVVRPMVFVWIHCRDILIFSGFKQLTIYTCNILFLK